jgi:peptidyl-prolyl cis-trans isomerase C
VRSLPLILLLAALLLTACQSTQNGQALVSAPDSPVIFSLDTERYTAADFERRLERDIGGAIVELLAQGQSPAEIEQLAADADIRAQIFDQMLQDALLSRHARQHGIGVDPDAIDAQVFASVPPDPDSPFLITSEERLRSAQGQLSFEVIARNTRAPMAWTRQILVADQAAADQVMAELAAGADFAALARAQSSDSVSAPRGGDLGWRPAGNYVPEYDEAVAVAPLNTPTIVVSQIGVHVFEVLGRDEQRPFESFEQLGASANAQQYFEQSFTPWYEELRREAQRSGDLLIAPNFDPNSAPLPFPDGV